jgi:hypothetical protein
LIPRGREKSVLFLSAIPGRKTCRQVAKLPRSQGDGAFTRGREDTKGDGEAATDGIPARRERGYAWDTDGAED